MQSNQFGPTQPWWRVGMWWLALGGPLLVALASVVTLVIAVRGGDKALSTVGRVSATTGAATTPAVQARNHAATSRH
jgi:uncharacterized protein